MIFGDDDDNDDDDCHSLLRVHDSLLSRVRAYTVWVSDMWVQVHPRAIFSRFFPGVSS